MLRYLSADYVFPVSAAPIPQGVLVVEAETGKITSLGKRADFDPKKLKIFTDAVLIPGFVNTHCHLELSHMRGSVDTGTGLIPFIMGVVTKRGAFSEKQIQQAIFRAEKEMLRGGIMAVGDISNRPDTFACKSKSALRFYTFVEMFDFLQDANAQKTMEEAAQVFEDLSVPKGHAKSFVPHAPYSVSASLFEKINKANPVKSTTVSIHNQETPPEQQLFLEKTGDFLDFYGSFGISLDKFNPTGKTAIHYALDHLNPQNRTLFVHNTLSSEEDIRAAHAWSDSVYWATCPNANLYIENRMPDYRKFLKTEARLSIGTDSLTSNWQLSVLEEMKTIHRFQRFVPWDDLLRWATLNGAEALGFEADLGSFEPGKTPGIVALSGLSKENKLEAKARVRRIL